VKTLEEVIQQLTENAPAFSQICFKTKDGDLTMLVDVCNQRIKRHLYTAHYFTGRLHQMQNTYADCIGVTEELRRLVNNIHAEITVCIDQMEKTEND
jgi:hypothetical protein